MSRNPFVRHGLARMEGYTMDTDIDVTVNEDGAPEGTGPEEAPADDGFSEIEESTEEAVGEVEEKDAEAQEAVEETMRLLADLEVYESFYDVVSEYGVSRPVVELMLAYDMDPKLLGITVDANGVAQCESFNIIGSTYSDDTAACLEGIGEHMKNAWGWIKARIENVCKAYDEFVKFFEKFRPTQQNLLEYRSYLVVSKKSEWRAGEKTHKAFSSKNVSEIISLFNKCNPTKILATMASGSKVAESNSKAKSELDQFEKAVTAFIDKVKSGREEIKVVEGDAKMSLDAATFLYTQTQSVFKNAASIKIGDVIQRGKIAIGNLVTKEERAGYAEMKAKIAFNSSCVSQLWRMFKQVFVCYHHLVSQAGTIIRRGYGFSLTA